MRGLLENQLLLARAPGFVGIYVCSERPIGKVSGEDGWFSPRIAS